MTALLLLEIVAVLVPLFKPLGLKKKNLKKIIYRKQQLERLKTIEQYTDSSRAEHALLEVSVEVVKQKSGKFFMVFH